MQIIEIYGGTNSDFFKWMCPISGNQSSPFGKPRLIPMSYESVGMRQVLAYLDKQNNTIYL